MYNGQKPISIGDIVFDAKKYSLDDRVTPEYNLKLKDMSKNDAGNYSCTESSKEISSYILIAKGTCYSVSHQCSLF